MIKQIKIRKKQYERLLKECRQLWNEFDPIGVYSEWDDEAWPRDEYDSYLRHTVELVASEADVYMISGYVRSVLHGSIGTTDFPEEEIVAFAERLKNRLTA